MSIHALLAEGDAIDMMTLLAAELFQSTPSSRRATTAQLRQRELPAISIHALLAEGDCRRWYAPARKRPISIHALLAEGDGLEAYLCGVGGISIHALLAEGDSKNS